MALNRIAAWTLIVGTAALTAAAARHAAAQDTRPAETQPAEVPKVGTTAPTAETYAAQIDRLANAKDLDDALRTRATAAYKEARAQLQVAADWRAKAAGFARAAKQAPAKLAETRKLLQQAETQPASTAPADADLAKAEQLLAEAEAELAARRKALADLQAEEKRRGERRQAVPKLLAAARQRTAELDTEMAELPPDLHPEVRAAETARIEARKDAAAAEAEALEKELAAYDAERDLITAGLDLAARRVARTEKRQKALRELVDLKRRQEAERAAAEARQTALRAAREHPVLKRLADENAELTAARTGAEGLAARIAEANRRLEELTASLDALGEGVTSLREREKIIGDTATFGVLLRKQRAELPDTGELRRRAAARQEETASVQLRLIELRDRRASLADIDSAAAETLASLPPDMEPWKRQAVADDVRERLETRREILDALIKDYDTYFGLLGELATKYQLLLTRADKAADYINERILWIRSAGPLGPGDVVEAGKAAAWLLAPSAVLAAGQVLLADAATSPVLYGVVLLALAAWLAGQRRLRQGLADSAPPAAAVADASILPTLSAVGLSALLAAALPALLGFLAWRLGGAIDAPLTVKALAGGLGALAIVGITLIAPLVVCRPAGLAEAHFHWPARTLAWIRTRLRGLLALLAVPAFLAGAMAAQPREIRDASLGRLALIAALIMLAVFAQRILRPRGLLVAQWARRGRPGPLYRLRHLWYALGVGGPVLLAVLAAMGFQYTAAHLAGRLTFTYWIAFALMLLNSVALRWVALAHRRLALQNLRRRTQAAAAAGGQEQDEQALAAEEAERREQEERLDAVNRQTRQLLRTVLTLAMVLAAWFVWSESLPALGALDRVELWTHTVTASAGGGNGAAGAVEEIVPVTLADLGIAVLMIVLTVVAARNVPGFLEIAVLQRIHVDAGVRYAVNAILRYAIGVAGIVLAFGAIGVTWSSVQWLVAAMTVGLGFGLQEIFANFVSGLIILFERPIRIGDTVTIGEITGSVSRIRIRATTITDWDRKELVVPNKEFVTGRLVNWSLSDKVLRVIVPVGVAYGSDTALAEKLLYEVADEAPAVLDDPKPLVLFSGFGDNALHFELRVYIEGIEHWLKVKHALHMAIDRAFRKAKITIAFPQRDTHLDTLRPLEVRVLPAEGKQQDEAD